MTLPMMTSSTASLGMPARRTASATTSAPSLVAEMLLKAPLNEPMGVRTALIITTSRTIALLLVMIYLDLKIPYHEVPTTHYHRSILCNSEQRSTRNAHT